MILSEKRSPVNKGFQLEWKPMTPMVLQRSKQKVVELFKAMKMCVNLLCLKLKCREQDVVYGTGQNIIIIAILERFLIFSASTKIIFHRSWHCIFRPPSSRKLWIETDLICNPSGHLNHSKIFTLFLTLYIIYQSSSQFWGRTWNQTCNWKQTNKNNWNAFRVQGSHIWLSCSKADINTQ